MGKGIDLGTPPDLRDAMENLRDQVLVALVKRAGPDGITISIEEVDSTGDVTVSMSIDHDRRTFKFTAAKKQ